MEDQNNPNNDQDNQNNEHAQDNNADDYERLLFGDLGGKTPKQILTLVNKLSHAFEMACLGDEQNREGRLLNVPNLKETINVVKRSIGLANDEYRFISQIEAGFTSLVEAGMAPHRIRKKHFREDFSMLKKFFERFNLSPGVVFAEFGKTLKAAAASLGVDERVLKNYTKDELKIINWPVGKSGGRILVQLRNGAKEYAYAFDLNLTDGVEVLNTKVLTWLGLNEDANNLIISYYAEGEHVVVDNHESWVTCKFFFANFDRLYLIATEN